MFLAFMGGALTGAAVSTTKLIETDTKLHIKLPFIKEPLLLIDGSGHPPSQEILVPGTAEHRLQHQTDTAVLMHDFAAKNGDIQFTEVPIDVAYQLVADYGQRSPGDFVKYNGSK